MAPCRQNKVAPRRPVRQVDENLGSELPIDTPLSVGCGSWNDLVVALFLNALRLHDSRKPDELADFADLLLERFLREGALDFVFMVLVESAFLIPWSQRQARRR
mgnify:CR=1 FL=1